MNDQDSFLFCLLSCGFAAFILLCSRIIPEISPVSLIGLILAVYFCSLNHRPGICLAIISGVITLILSLRFPYLSWGDPWQDYEGIYEVLIQGTTAMAGFRLQQPMVPVAVLSVSGFTGFLPLLIQKIIIPLLGSLSVVIIYVIGKELSDQKTALTGALIYLTGIPFLHWSAQGVRETLGIPFFLISIYLSHRAVRTGKPSDICSAFLVIAGLVLTHHQSALFFLLIFTAMMIGELYLFTSSSQMKRSASLICLISGYTLFITLLWWKERIPWIYTYFIGLINRMGFWEGNLGITPIICGCLFIVLITFLPVIFPNIVSIVRDCVNLLYRQEKLIQIGLVFAGLSVTILIITLFSGYTSLSVQYPPHMILAGFLILLLFLSGIHLFLTNERIYLLIFAFIPAIMFFVGITRILPGVDSLLSGQIDPLRFLGYLWPPVALIAGSGLVRVSPTEKVWRICLSVIFVISLLAVFPSIVLLGETFSPGNPFYDNRSFVISHPVTEIQAITWYGGIHTSGSITSDRYAFSPARWLNVMGKTVKSPKSRPFEGDQSENWLITDRMKTYANFAEWITAPAHPLNTTEIMAFEQNTTRMYDNGNARIYRIVSRSS